MCRVSVALEVNDTVRITRRSERCSAAAVALIAMLKITTDISNLCVWEWNIFCLCTFCVKAIHCLWWSYDKSSSTSKYSYRWEIHNSRQTFAKNITPANKNRRKNVIVSDFWRHILYSVSHLKNIQHTYSTQKSVNELFTYTNDELVKKGL